jgi:hypothetical protein
MLGRFLLGLCAAAAAASSSSAAASSAAAAAAAAATAATPSTATPSTAATAAAAAAASSLAEVAQRAPLFTLRVRVSGGVAELPFFEGDDVDELAARFCEEVGATGLCIDQIRKALIRNSRMRATGRVTPAGSPVHINHSAALMPWAFPDNSTSTAMPRRFRLRGDAHVQGKLAQTGTGVPLPGDDRGVAMVPPDDAHSEDGEAGFLEALKADGYAVVRGAASAPELRELRVLLWEYLAKFDGQNAIDEAVGAVVFGVGGGTVRRGRPAGWWAIPSNGFGITLVAGVAHEPVMWAVRKLDVVLRAFELIWGRHKGGGGADDASPSEGWVAPHLISDYGGAGLFRPGSLNESWRSDEGWLHTDQNAETRPGRQTVQAFVSLYDQDEETGGLVVLPRTHLDHEAFSARANKYWDSGGSNHFLYAPPDDELMVRAAAAAEGASEGEPWAAAGGEGASEGGRAPRLVKCRAGDMVLWDSRLLHANTGARAGARVFADEDMLPPPCDASGGGTGANGTATTSSSSGSEAHCASVAAAAVANRSAVRLQRAVLYMSMTDRSRASSAVLRERKRGIVDGVTTTHWPFDFVGDPPQPGDRFERLWLERWRHDALVRRLVGYDPLSAAEQEMLDAARAAAERELAAAATGGAAAAAAAAAVEVGAGAEVVGSAATADDDPDLRSWRQAVADAQAHSD